MGDCFQLITFKLQLPDEIRTMAEDTMIPDELKTMVEFQTKVLDKRVTLIGVYFYTTWCSPSVLLAKAEPSITWFRVNSEYNQDTIDTQNIRVIPTIKLYKSGDCVETLEGDVANKVIPAIARHR